MQTASQTFSLVAGRALLALVFLASAVGKFLAWDSVVGFMAMCNVPWPGAFLAGAVALELGGSLSLLLGWKARTGAKALIAVLIPATLMFHSFWTVGSQDMREQLLQFLKNLSILGGLLLITVHGSGPWSLDTLKRGISRRSVSGREPARTTADFQGCH